MYRVRRMEGHRARVGCLAWNSHMLSSGGRDRLIMQRDIRAPEDVVSTLTGHRSEVFTCFCVCIYPKLRLKKRKCTWCLRKLKAIETLAMPTKITLQVVNPYDSEHFWRRCNWQDNGTKLGTSNKRRRCSVKCVVEVGKPFHATLSPQESFPMQLCGLKWSPDDRELASGGNDNQLNIWNSSSTSPVVRFQGHLAAVKAISWSPHQQSLLASGGGTADRCIRFWHTATATEISSIDTGTPRTASRHNFLSCLYRNGGKLSSIPQLRGCVGVESLEQMLRILQDATSLQTP